MEFSYSINIGWKFDLLSSAYSMWSGLFFGIKRNKMAGTTNGNVFIFRWKIPFPFSIHRLYLAQIQRLLQPLRVWTFVSTKVRTRTTHMACNHNVCGRSSSRSFYFHSINHPRFRRRNSNIINGMSNLWIFWYKVR